MGGRSNSRPSRVPAGGSAPLPGGEGDGTGSGVAPGDPCPPKFTASVAGPVQGITAGTWLDVALQGSGARMVVFIDPVSGQIVGALTAVPNLAVFIQCLADGIVYRAFVTKVSGGRIDVAIVRQ